MNKVIISLLSAFLWCAIGGNLSLLAQSKSFLVSSYENIDKAFAVCKTSEMLVADINFISEIPIDIQELIYLLGFDRNDIITPQMLQAAWKMFAKKEHFYIKSILISPQDAGYSFEISLEPVFIFTHLKINGYFFGKDQYKNCYFLKIGTPFKEDMHAYSIQDIHKLLEKHGYLDHDVKDVVYYNKKDRTVQVTIQISRGPQFQIGKVDFTCEHNSIDPHEIEELQERCLAFFKKSTILPSYYDDAVVEQSKKKIVNLLHRKGFSKSEVAITTQVHSQDSLVDIHIKLILQRNREFVFFGNHFFSSEQLLENISLYGKSSWKLPIAIVQDEISQAYQRKGFWSVQVSIKEENARTFCIINEGQRVKLQEVVYKNFSAFPLEDIKKHFKRLIKARFFDKDEVAKAIESLQRMYVDSGYWDFKIIKQESIKIDENIYNLVLICDEGLPSTIVKIDVLKHSDIVSQIPYAKDIALGNVHLKKEIVQAQKDWLYEYFKEKGHSYTSIEHVLEEVRPHQYQILWNIVFTKTDITFGKTVIKGNNTIPFKYIKRELKYEEGQYWNNEDVEKTLRRLRDLDIYESVHMYPSEEVDDNNTRPVILNLIENDRYEARMRIGFQYAGAAPRTTTYKAGGTFLLRNPLRRGDKFEVNGDFTMYYGNFSMQYTMPWLFSRPIRSFVKFYDNRYNQPVFLGGSTPFYKALQQGLVFSIDEQYEKYNYGASFGCETVQITNEVPGFAQTINYDESLLGQKIAYFYLEPIFMVDQRNNVLNPRIGFFTLLSCKAMFDMTSQTTFFRVAGEHSFFTPFHERVVLGVRMRVGHTFNRLYTQLNPIERFYLGGAHSIRSYPKDYCPPLGLLAQQIPDVNGLPDSAGGIWRYAPQGGRTFLNANLELRCNVYKSLDAVVFQDLGALIQDSISDAMDNILAGSGFGIRYQTPIGPLRFDIAWKWKIQYPDFEAPWVFWLSLGHAF